MQAQGCLSRNMRPLFPGAIGYYFPNKGQHVFCYSLNNWHNHCVAELLVGLRI